MFETILVAAGPSPWSRNAIITAVQLATSLDKGLLIAHILEDDPQYQALDLDLSEPSVHQQFEETGQIILDNAVEHAQQAEVPYRTFMQWGSIPEEIVQLAQREGCDLIVMGTRHMTGDKRLMTGRICNAVLATAPCPVLVVPLVLH